MTLGEARRKTVLDLRTIQAEHEVREIIPFVTERAWSFVLAHDTDIVSDLMQEKLNHVIKERLSGRPLAYIIGEWSFFGHRFAVDERVLIPREDTEVLLKVAMEEIQRNGYQTALDLCTGSGCIGITLALETKAMISACDISQNALAVARENAEQLHASVHFFEADLFAPCDRTFDVIVSNPPYISEQEYATLQREVQDFEPKLALVAEDDGLDYYRRITKEAKQYINPLGMLAVEIGFGQYEAVYQLFYENDWHDIQVQYDLAGIERVIFAFAAI